MISEQRNTVYSDVINYDQSGWVGSFGWTLYLQRRIQVMEMRCYRKILHISYKDHITNEESVPRSSRKLDHTKTS